MFARTLPSRQILSTASSAARLSRGRVASYATATGSAKPLIEGAKYSSEQVIHMEHEVSLAMFNSMPGGHGTADANCCSTLPTTIILCQCKSRLQANRESSPLTDFQSVFLRRQRVPSKKRNPHLERQEAKVAPTEYGIRKERNTSTCCRHTLP